MVKLSTVKKFLAFLVATAIMVTSLSFTALADTKDIAPKGSAMLLYQGDTATYIGGILYDYYSTDGKKWFPITSNRAAWQYSYSESKNEWIVENAGTINVTSIAKANKEIEVLFADDLGLVVKKTGGKFAATEGVYCFTIPKKSQKIDKRTVGPAGTGISYEFTTGAALLVISNHNAYAVEYKVGLNAWERLEPYNESSTNNSMSNAEFPMQPDGFTLELRKIDNGPISDVIKVKVAGQGAAPKNVYDAATASVKGFKTTQEYAIVKRTVAASAFASLTKDELLSDIKWNEVTENNSTISITDEDAKKAQKIGALKSDEDAYVVAVLIRNKTAANSTSIYPSSKIQVINLVAGAQRSNSPKNNKDFILDYETGFFYSITSEPLEYSTNGTTWTLLTDKAKAKSIGTILKSENTTLYVRFKAVTQGTGKNLKVISTASVPWSETFVQKQAPAPAINRDNINFEYGLFERLGDVNTLLVATGTALTINANTVWTKVSDISTISGALYVEVLDAGVSKNALVKYAFRTANTGAGSLPSAATSIITVPARPAANTLVKRVTSDKITINEETSKIECSMLKTSMEVSINTEEWFAVGTDGEFPAELANTINSKASNKNARFYVRLKATSSAFASSYETVLIPDDKMISD